MAVAEQITGEGRCGTERAVKWLGLSAVFLAKVELMITNLKGSHVFAIPKTVSYAPKSGNSAPNILPNRF